MIFDIHVHTNAVDGKNTPREVVEQARKIGLDGIAIVDHNEVRGSIEAQKLAGTGFTVVPGIEFSTTGGHIICLGSVDVPEKYLGVTYKREKYAAPEEILDLIKDIGGIAIAAHPYDKIRKGVGDVVYDLSFDAIEVKNGHTLLNTKNPLQVADELGLPKVGGSDAHNINEIGNICIEFEGEDVIEAIRENSVKIVSKSRLTILASFMRSGILKAYFGFE
ncbi:MAG: CehA/McbA family metallohydrolase [Methanobacteriota archaeon]